MSRRPLLVAGTIAVIAIPVGIWTASGAEKAGFSPDLSGPDRLVTNEYTHWNPYAPNARRSRDWDVTSGSLFVRDGVGWTGIPDAVTPDSASSAGTGSSVFRMNSFRRDLGDVLVTLQVRNLRLLDQGGRTPPAETDGIHLFLRRQDPTKLYAISLNRRDNQIVIKKKLPGGIENGGTYHTLAQTPYAPPPGTWQPFTIKIASTAPTQVTITVAQQDRQLIKAHDNGAQGPPILHPGAIGLRGDNCEFEFRNLQARPLN